MSFVELPDDAPLDHETGAAPAVAPAAAQPPAATAEFTPEERSKIVHFAAKAKSAKELEDYVLSFGKGLGVSNAQEIIDHRNKHGQVSTEFVTHGADAQPADTVPEGYEAIPADAPVDYGTLSGLSPDEINAKFAPLHDSMKPGTADLLGHGALAGIETDANAGVDSLGAMLLHPLETVRTHGRNIVDAYHQGRIDSLARVDYAKMHSIGGGLPGEIVGTMANPIGAEAKGLGGLAKVGAGYGFVSGAEDSNGTLGERALEGVKGAAVGAIAAPAIGVALRAPGAVVSGAKSVMEGAPGLARRVVSRAIKADANTPTAIGEEMARAQGNGVPMMLADTGENARGLLAASVRSPGPGRTLARDALEERQEGLHDRVIGAIERDLGPVANPHQVADELLTAAKEKAGPLYDRAYAAPAVSSPAIDALLERPSMQRALGKAMRIAAEEGRDPKELGFALDANGDVVLHPPHPELFGAQAQARSELTDAQQALKAARRKVGQPSLLDHARQRVEDAREALRSADTALAAVPSAGTAATTKNYSTQTLDYVKRGMDDVIESYRDKTSGRLVLDTEGRAINNTLRSFLGLVDKLNPTYAQARAAYGGPVSGISAMNTGRRALNMTADDLEARIRDMSPFEKQMFALGARRAMAELVASKGDTANVANALVGSGKKRAMLSRLFGNRQQFGRFVETLGQEREAFRTFAKATQGSPTAANLQDDAALTVATATADLVANGGLPIGSAIKMAAKFGKGMLSEKARQEVATLLSETDPARFHELAAELHAQAARRGLRLQKIDRAAVAGGKAVVAVGH